MNDTSAQFHISRHPMIYRGEAGLVDKGPANDHSSIIRLPHLTQHREMSLSLSKVNPTFITEKKKGTPMIHDRSSSKHYTTAKATWLVYPHLRSIS